MPELYMRLELGQTLLKVMYDQKWALPKVQKFTVLGLESLEIFNILMERGYFKIIGDMVVDSNRQDRYVWVWTDNGAKIDTETWEIDKALAHQFGLKQSMVWYSPEYLKGIQEQIDRMMSDGCPNGD